MRKFFAWIFFSAVCLSIGKGWHWAKDGFSLNRIQVWPSGFNSGIDDESKAALDQTYYYLSRGHQCYAFSSADGNYVIKIPRTDRYRLPFWIRSLPFHELREKKRGDHLSREKSLLESFRISFEELKEQTALLAMHLSRSEDRGEKIVISDRFRRKFVLSLHNTAFILQRKKPILMDVFQQALSQGRTAEAKKALEAFLDVVVARARKGILNKDPSFIRNFGYDGKEAFQIDIGSFYRKGDIWADEVYRKSIRETLHPVRLWLADLDPELLQFVDEKLDLYYKEAL